MLISYSIRAENALNVLIYLHAHASAPRRVWGNSVREKRQRKDFTNNLQVTIDSAEATGDIFKHPNGTISVSLKRKRGMKDK